jgi:cellulose synthase/poly-beta-1,6-N-acetylglucosamine synthase-like glycosyltransferase
MNFIDIINDIMMSFFAVWGIIAIQNFFFSLVGIITPTKKIKKTGKRYKYAVLIAARNEEKDIEQCIDSVKKQNYDKDKITIFVVAHNCTDKTAELARAVGTIVYEYNNPKERSKGFALKYLVNKIKEDYSDGIYTFDGYFFIDADVVVDNSYITEMNNGFDDKNFDYFNSYINAKNTDMGFWATKRSITCYKDNFEHYRPKSFLGISQQNLGMCWLVRNYILHDGYKWVGFADDVEFSCDVVSQGYRGTFIESAVFFTEMPKSFYDFFKQQTRWARTTLIAFLKYFHKLILGFFLPYDFFAKKEKREKIQRPKQNIPKKILEQILLRLSCYDIFVKTFPVHIPCFLVTVVGIISLTHGNQLIIIFYFFGSMHLFMFIPYICVLIRERKHIRATPNFLIYIFVWPFIDWLLNIINFASYFMPHKWYPMKRYDTRKIDAISKLATLDELGGVKNKTKYILRCMIIAGFGLSFSVLGVCLFLRHFIHYGKLYLLPSTDPHWALVLILAGTFIFVFMIWKIIKTKIDDEAKSNKILSWIIPVLSIIFGLFTSTLDALIILKRCLVNFNLSSYFVILLMIIGIVAVIYGCWKLIVEKKIRLFK